MDRFVDIWKAARIAGVSRAELQSHIAQGTLHSFEGRIDVGELHRLYPELNRGRSRMLEFVERIKEDAVHKSVRGADRGEDTGDPSAELVAMRRDRDHYREENARNRLILDDVERMLEDLAARVEPPYPVKNLLLWLRGKRG